ncbi:hypothetical protein KA005_70750, partial [bacterium]|nr:hypothetical protein [bacterium]
MNVYGKRIEATFSRKIVVDYYNPNALDTPCLILLHPASQDDIGKAHAKQIDSINQGKIAVLVLSGSVCQPPNGANPDFFHCLSYGIPNPCGGDIVERFNKLICRVRKLSDWSGVDMRSLWEIVDPPYPEYLVAWYLFLVARD